LGIAGEEEGFGVDNVLAFTNFFIAILCFSIRPNYYLKIFSEGKKYFLLIFVYCKNNFKIFLLEQFRARGENDKSM